MKPMEKPVKTQAPKPANVTDSRKAMERSIAANKKAAAGNAKALNTVRTHRAGDI